MVGRKHSWRLDIIKLPKPTCIYDETLTNGIWFGYGYETNFNQLREEVNGRRFGFWYRTGNMPRKWQ